MQRYRTNAKWPLSPTLRQLDRQMENVYCLDDFAPPHPNAGAFLDSGDARDESKYIIRDDGGHDHGKQ